MNAPRPASEQIAATDPGRSNWVGANAGSGKTHVLTQRVARLLLEGALPQRILCLTYTRAAAAEMQSRLFRTLGRWAMAPADRLGQTLASLAGETSPITDAARLAEARRLFARALETPGGLKIQTIHAFCTEVLRRFPLEAGVSPRFAVADDRDAGALMANVKARLAEAAPQAFDIAAQRLTEDGIDALAHAVLRHGEDFGGDVEAALAAHFGDAATRTPPEIAAAALNELAPAHLESLAEALKKGGKSEQGLATVFSDWLDGRIADARAACDDMARHLLTKDGAPRQSGMPTRATVKLRPDAPDEIARLQDWAARTGNAIRAGAVAARARDLHVFAKDLLTRHEAAKAATALLDFDDLVRRTRALLTDGAMRDWVLWKLDQGLDHILVDEAQDTAPAQWEVIAALADEFLAGAGARPVGRSIFVVGDEKQSIYSFQGAEPGTFGRMRDHFTGRLAALGTPLGRPDLVTSYRSAPAILQFVDAVFVGDAAAGLTVSGDPVCHLAHRKGAHGRVDLWPVIEPADKPDEPAWHAPVDAVPASDTKLRLAIAIAKQIEAMIGHDWLGPRPPDRAARPIRAGDILVLVTRRDRLASGLIRELKARGVPVAGADRMVLTAEIAVQDLLALARVACQPGDDLSLAALLKSPLCGLDEDALFDLAWDRKGTLWQAVQGAARHAPIAAFLADMAAQADFLRPYEFLERALIRHDGRRKLAARLGPEAEDAIDELLTQALTYEGHKAPSLTGFIAWIEAGDIQVKREMEGAGDAVRVMTVHGAKGLEAPVVILPDTVSAGRSGRGPLLLSAERTGNRPALTLWLGAREQDDEVAAAAREAAEARQKAERKRLLYVALTRAEDWLILCGAGLRKGPKENWHATLTAGMEALPDLQTLPGPTGEGEMLRFETGPVPRPEGVRSLPARAAPPPPPGWIGPAKPETRRPRPSPSALAPPAPHGGTGIGREMALALGSAVHLLLERLPAHPAEAREILAVRLLAHDFPELAAERREAAWAEARRVLAMPAAGIIFGPDSLAEVSAAIPGPDGRRMIGRIDRLIVTSDEILILDFKTDRAPPASVAGVPRGYLAQLGAYRAALVPAFPGKPVTTALLWTAGPEMMRLDGGTVDGAFRAAVAETTRNIDSGPGSA